MWKDSIVEEVHKIREHLVKESEYDLNIYFEKLKKNGRKRETGVFI